MWPSSSGSFFEQVQCAVDNALYLRDLVLQGLAKIIVMLYKRLKIKIQMWYFTRTQQALRTDKKSN